MYFRWIKALLNLKENQNFPLVAFTFCNCIFIDFSINSKTNFLNPFTLKFVNLGYFQKCPENRFFQVWLCLTIFIYKHKILPFKSLFNILYIKADVKAKTNENFPWKSIPWWFILHTFHVAFIHIIPINST